MSQYGDLLQLPLRHAGKVRELYDVEVDGVARILMVATDNISAYDHVLSTPIPGKGEILTALSLWWFDQLADLVDNHVVSTEVPEAVAGRATVVEALDMVDVECVARGYLTGSGWTEYQESRTVCGIPLPEGLRDGDKLPEPIFTPATKAEQGDHDENISFEQAQIDCGAALSGILAGTGKNGAQIATEARNAALALYTAAADYALTRNIIIADTKFEFGVDSTGTLHLIDEALTPDSSRFWPMEAYAVGSNPPSYDKQYVRDHLETLDWNKTAPGPSLPADVIARTSGKYREAYEQLTGMKLAF